MGSILGYLNFGKVPYRPQNSKIMIIGTANKDALNFGKPLNVIGPSKAQALRKMRWNSGISGRGGGGGRGGGAGVEVPKIS